MDRRRFLTTTAIATIGLGAGSLYRMDRAWAYLPSRPVPKFVTPLRRPGTPEEIAFLGEPLTWAKVLGLVFALAATWLLLGGGNGKQARVSRSTLQALIATASFGASNFCHTVGLRHGVLPETMAAAQATLFMPLATLVVFVADRKLPPPPAAFKFGAPAAVLILVATLALLRGIAIGQASVLVPIAQMGFIVAAVLGIVVLREPVTTRKATGLAAALAALAILAAS